jgi:hypothetical protein
MKHNAWRSVTEYTVSQTAADDLREARERINKCLEDGGTYLSLAGLRLSKFPASILRLRNVRFFDISYTGIQHIPCTIVFCRKLSVNGKGIFIASVINHIVRLLEKKLYFITERKMRLYDYMFLTLSEMQKKLDVCFWHNEDGAVLCRRPENQCCVSGGHCGFLDEQSGCRVKSLACKVWLCKQALDYVTEVASNKTHEMRSSARRYLRFRKKCDFWCRALGIDLKGRSSKDEVFDPDCDKTMNMLIKRWYDNIYLRPKGCFPSRNKIELERESSKEVDYD